MKKLHSLVILFTLSFAVLFFATAPAFAGFMDVTAFPLIKGNCTGILEIHHDFSYSGTTIDITMPNRDAMALVLYDGHGDAFAYIGISLGVPAVPTVGTATNFTWLYPILVQPKSRPFTMKIFDNTTVVSTVPSNLAGAQHGNIVDVVHFDPAQHGVCTFLPLYAPPEAPLQPNFSDGRINNWDTGAPVVVFGQDFAEGRGLAVYSPEGELLMLVHPDEIAAVPECPAQNSLIANGGTIAFSRLANCSYQINAPSLDGTKTYVLIFNAFFADTGYQSYEE